jgi:uncharacterized membrane protein
MYCKNCGKQVVADTAFCPGCGAYPGSGKNFCSACGGHTTEMTGVCLKCSSKLASTPLAAAAPVSSVAPPPGVSAPFNWAWKVLWPNFWMLLLIFIIYAAISSISSGFSAIPGAGGFISGVFSVFIGIPLGLGYAYVFLKAARKEKFEIEDLFAGFKVYWTSIGASLLTGLIVAGGLILVIVPGIVFACKLAFVPYLVIDRKMGVTEAISASWKMTRGHTMEVFAIGLLSILIIIAGFICLIVGVFVAILWIELAFTSLYYAVSAEQKGETGTTVVPEV